MTSNGRVLVAGDGQGGVTAILVTDPPVTAAPSSAPSATTPSPTASPTGETTEPPTSTPTDSPTEAPTPVPVTDTMAPSMEPTSAGSQVSFILAGVAGIVAFLML